MADPEDWPPPAAIIRFADGDPGEIPWVNGAPAAETVEVVAYASEWPARFAAAKQIIADALGDIALNIEHVGSTAVPKLAAKPVIDIDLIVDDPTREDAYEPALSSLGYALTIREPSWYEHRMFRRTEPRINLHVFGRACPEHARHILFRDWLRSHPADCARYERAKRDARTGAADVQAYNRNKQAVIRDIYTKLFAGRGWLS